VSPASAKFAALEQMIHQLAFAHPAGNTVTCFPYTAINITLQENPFRNIAFFAGPVLIGIVGSREQGDIRGFT
jgi:hypothetical protein